MRKFIPFIALALLAVGCKGGESTAATTGGSTGGSTGSVASADKTYTLKMAPKAGEKYSYVMTTDGAGSNNEIGMTMACEKAEGDKFTLVTTFDSMKMNGKEAPAMVMDTMKKMKVISEMDASGKTLSTKMEGAPAGTPTPDSSSVSYPSGPIKVGDTWEGTTKVSGAEIKAKYKLAKVETVGGKEAATIEVTMEGLPSGAMTDGPTINVIELANGMPIEVSTKIKMKGPDGKEISMSTGMKRK